MTATVSPGQRFGASQPCPICGGFDGLVRGVGRRCSGYLSADAQYAHCSRDELAGGLPQESGGTYAHRLQGPCRCGQEHGAAAAQERPVRSGSSLGQPSKIYIYTSAEGAALFEVCRFGEGKQKTFRQRRSSENGRWIWNVPVELRTLYRLHELVRAPAGELVFLVEGEKDADRLSREGLVATTNPMGAEKWLPGYTEQLRGRRVCIVPDNDAENPKGNVGYKYAEDIAAQLQGVASEVKVLHLPGVPEDGGDVSDWCNAGGTAAELYAMAETAPAWTPPPARPAAAVSEEPEDPRNRLTDVGNGIRLARRHGRDLHYCERLGGWLVWNGSAWQVDHLGEVDRRAKHVARQIYHEAAESEDSNLREALLRHAKRSSQAGGITAMLRMAQSEAGIPLLPEEADDRDQLFNALGGTVEGLGGHQK